jgi:uncharacterized protein (TIGR02679 family)
MTGTDDVEEALPERLVARADTPGLAPLWRELARRLGASDRPVRRVRLSGLTAGQREALADLLGLAQLPGPATPVRVAQVCAALRVDEVTLHRLVERLAGPIDNRAARRARELQARRRLWETVEDAVAGRGLEEWVARLRAGGVPEGDVAGHTERLAPLLELVTRLPLAPPRPLAIVAQQHLGDPHGMDLGSWAGAVVADAAATLVGLPPPVTAQDTRAALAAVGIVADPLSSPVLTLGLRGPGAAPEPGWLATMAAAGEPLTLTASQLRRWPVTSDATDVRVVENPSVIAAATDAGVTRPLVCTASWPTQAGVLLLDQLRDAGARLHYHGDVDPTGLVLAEHHRQRFGARPWRMSAADYLAAVGAATTPIDPGTAIPATPWDPALAEAVRVYRRVVFEEQVVDLLLADLGA